MLLIKLTQQIKRNTSAKKKNKKQCKSKPQGRMYGPQAQLTLSALLYTPPLLWPPTFDQTWFAKQNSIVHDLYYAMFKLTLSSMNEWFICRRSSRVMPLVMSNELLCFIDESDTSSLMMVQCESTSHFQASAVSLCTSPETSSSLCSLRHLKPLPNTFRWNLFYRKLF